MDNKELQNLHHRQSFSDRLQYVLQEKKIQPCTQAQLAKMFNVTPKSIRRWLDGSSMPNQYRIISISEQLGVRVEWFLYGSGDIYIEQSIYKPSKDIFSALSEKELHLVLMFRQIDTDKQNCLSGLFNALTNKGA